MDSETLKCKLDNYVWNVHNVLPNDDNNNRHYMEIAYRLPMDVYRTIADEIHKNVFNGLHAYESDYIVAIGYVYNNLIQ